MALFKCKMCGGALDVSGGETVAICEYCGTKQTLPKLDDEKKANLYDRANHFRRGNDFDKAAAIYEQILDADTEDAEAYWSLVLCRYGIEYVEDPTSHKRIPTVNRAQFTSIFADEDYKSAIKYADGYQKEIYEQEAKTIDGIQKEILLISQKEEPFDVFICYKETDASGRRTQDSVLANDLYHQLTQEGFKVFFSRITLEDKLGTAYEPYIFAALNSAKVMVVLGTKAEYFNAVWVKNEWSRYLALIKNGAKKTLIPAYRDMDPYDLPEEFSHLQAQDMSKLGFMQDLIRGIKKIVNSDAQNTSVIKETVISSGSTNVAPLLRRAFMFLEDGDWKNANDYCEKVLDLEPENAEAYLGKLMAENQARKAEDLKNISSPFENSHSRNYEKIMRFGSVKLKEQVESYNQNIKDRLEEERLREKNRLEEKRRREEALQSLARCKKRIAGVFAGVFLSVIILIAVFFRFGVPTIKYNKAVELYNTGTFEEAMEALGKIKGSGFSEKQLTNADNMWQIMDIYYDAVELYNCGDYAEACKQFVRVKNYRDSESKYMESAYQIAIELRNNKDYDSANAIFEALKNYRDSEELIY